MANVKRLGGTMQYLMTDDHAEDIRKAQDNGVFDWLIYGGEACTVRVENGEHVIRDDRGWICEPLKGQHVQNVRFFKFGRDFIPHAEVIPSMFGGAA